jgi:hypothetical protein
MGTGRRKPEPLLLCCPAWQASQWSRL